MSVQPSPTGELQVEFIHIRLQFKTCRSEFTVLHEVLVYCSNFSKLSVQPGTIQSSSLQKQWQSYVQVVVHDNGFEETSHLTTI